MKQKHYTRHVMLCLLSVFIVGLIIVVPGCAQEEIQKEAIVEPEIPTHFSTYTDEMALFRISYPPDWETALSIIEEAREYIDEAIRNIDENLPMGKVSFLFFAGLPIETGYMPNVSIALEPLPLGVSTNDEYAEAGIQGIKSVIEDYHKFTQIKTTIDGREAIIIEAEGTFPGLPKTHTLQMYIIQGKNGWAVTCTSIGEFSKWEDDFYAIVRSLRILK